MSFANRFALFQNRIIFIGLLVLAIMLFVLPSIPVEAHSSLEKTYPEAGVVDKPPSKVEIWFQDPVTIHSESIIVTNEQEVEVQKGQPFVDAKDPRHVIIFLKEDLSPGFYTVRMNVIAPDGWVLEESYRFMIRDSSVSGAAQTTFELEKARPGDGTIVKKSPKQMEMWFSLPAELTAFGVFDDKKQVVPTKEPYVDPNNPKHVIIEFKEELSPGTYQVSWYANPTGKYKNELGFEVQGVFYFAVDEVTSIISTQGEPTGGWLSDIGGKPLAYWLSFMGLLTLFGGAWFYSIIAKEKGNMERWNKISVLLYILSIVGFIFLLIQRYSEFAGLSFAEFVSLKFTWVPALQILLLTLGYWLRRGKIGLVFYGFAVLLWPFASGHSSYPRYGGLWMMGIDFLHLLAVSVWMGGLFALISMMPKEHALTWLKKVGLAYSKWAFWSLIVIVLTGTVMTFNFVPSFSFSSLFLSDWGKSLLVKVVLVIGIGFLGYLQRRSLKRMAAKGILSFVRRARIELIYGVLILFAAGLLIVATPTAAEQGVYPQSVVKEDMKATVEISPFRVGTNAITVHFQNEPELEQVRVKFFMPPDWRVENKAFPLGEGKYRVTGNFLHASGTMYMEVEAFKTNGEKIVFPFRIVIPGEIRLYE